MRLRLRVLMSLIALGVAASPAGASVAVPLGLDELVSHAERIAVARVESQEARWTADHDAIYTEVTLRLVRPMKGAGKAGDTVTLRREGGVVDGIGMRVYGAANFQTGEEVVVFMERRGASLWTVGMSQGKMHVEMMEGRKVAMRQNAGLAWLAGKAPPNEPAVRPLEELCADIANRVAKSAGSVR